MTFNNETSHINETIDQSQSKDIGETCAEQICLQEGTDSTAGITCLGEEASKMAKPIHRNEGVVESSGAEATKEEKYLIPPEILFRDSYSATGQPSIMFKPPLIDSKPISTLCSQEFKSLSSLGNSRSLTPSEVKSHGGDSVETQEVTLSTFLSCSSLVFG